MKYISAKGLSAAVVRKCLIRTSVQTAPFILGSYYVRTELRVELEKI